MCWALSLHYYTTYNSTLRQLTQWPIIYVLIIYDISMAKYLYCTAQAGWILLVYTRCLCTFVCARIACRKSNLYGVITRAYQIWNYFRSVAFLLRQNGREENKKKKQSKQKKNVTCIYYCSDYIEESCWATTHQSTFATQCTLLVPRLIHHRE